MFESIFETVNSGFAQALYEDYLRDPSSVPPEWRALFESQKGHAPVPPAREPSGDAARGDQDVSGAPPSPDRAGAAPSGQGSVEPIKGPALRLLQNMEASLAVPTATSFRDIDVTRLWSQRAALNAQLAAHDLKLSFTHYVGWAIVQAAHEFPVMTHHVQATEDGPARVDPGSLNLGLAVDVEGRGGSRRLLVPVIRGAGRLTFREFYQEYERLVAGARDGALLPDAYAGATVTLTNPGTLGTVASVPRLMRGQGSIVATGAIRPVAGQRIMTVTSTYDHRIIQGAESGMFLRRIDQLLQGDARFYRVVAEAMGARATAVEAASAALATATPPTAEPAAPAHELQYHIAAAMSLVRAHRTHGYLAASLDPLGTPPKGDPALDPDRLDLTPEIMRRIPADVLRIYVDAETLLDALPRLQATYCGTIAYEIEHIASHDERLWLRRVIESGEHRVRLTVEERKLLFAELTRVEALEQFLHRHYVGHKRFGVEGLDMLVPMLHLAIDLAHAHGAREAVMGMAHRGRLNVLAHILGRPYDTLLAEFEGGREVEETLAPRGGTGDVKYHHGAEGAFRCVHGTDLAVTLLPNPSHLEAVDPAVLGSARARQTDRSGRDARHDPMGVLPILIHGDAAFAAQGVVAESLNLARLAGYSTGGTLHVIANNQVGFTTNPSEARSTDFASDLAKGFDVPIVHVNADDPEGCLAAVRLAMMYRERFRGDCVINLVGYRRHGHNEGDEPRYTQPVMYQRIDAHPSVRRQYGRQLVAAGLLSEDDVEREAERVHDELVATRDRLRADLADGGEEPVRISGLWTPPPEPETAVPVADLEALNEELYRVPDGFSVHPKLVKLLARNRQAVPSREALDWAHAEALAIAALRADGVPVRFVGQDTVRGTFSQRHLTLFDAATGDPYTPIQQVAPARAPLELHNTPLSEYAALGFEYGYAVAAPDALVVWEAQFGDFANTGAVVIDQFIVAGLAKWGQTSRLTLLLPHGYEGQGPEHSSARLERYLALGAEGNIRVANCSTPAQYFHLLRWQAMHQEMRPLVLMTPKSLLRHPKAVSALAELAEGRFLPVLEDPAPPQGPDAVTRLVLCSGKVYYDLVDAEARARAPHVAIGRVELLYPFPRPAIADLFGRFPRLEQVVWLQEEPTNMGARKWAVPQLREIAGDGVEVRWIARPERSSPAEGYPAAHRVEQLRLVSEALR